MKWKNLIEALVFHPDWHLAILLPNGDLVPDHFHVTEVGRVLKEFYDCGGVRRATEACVIQAWTADDTDHRLKAGKLAGIIGGAMGLLGDRDIEVEVEYGPDAVSTYRLDHTCDQLEEDTIFLVLKGKATECLAPDKCGVKKCGPAGCC